MNATSKVACETRLFCYDVYYIRPSVCNLLLFFSQRCELLRVEIDYLCTLHSNKVIASQVLTKWYVVVQNFDLFQAKQPSRFKSSVPLQLIKL